MGLQVKSLNGVLNPKRTGFRFLTMVGLLFFVFGQIHVANASGIKCKELLINQENQMAANRENPARVSMIRSMNKILIVAAMDVEAKAILAKLPAPQSFSLHDGLGISVFRSTIGNREIALVQSGVGLVNGALTTSYAVDQVKPDAIFLLGVAGALGEQLNVGDTVVAKQVLQHDAVYSGDAVEFMAPGELHVSIPKDERRSPWLVTNPDLSIWVANQLSVIAPVHPGTILSGSEFVGNLARKRELAAITHDGLAVEMEAAGVGQVATKRGIPLVVVKTIADRLRPDGSISSDYLKFAHSASETASHIVSAIVAAWSE